MDRTTGRGRTLPGGWGLLPGAVGLLLLLSPVSPAAEVSPLLVPVPAAAVAPAPQDAQMAAIAEQADGHIRQGMILGGRAAYFSARAEFLQALRLISQAYDAQQGTARHGRALAAGLRALREADDFVPRGFDVEADLDLRIPLAAHLTPVLKDVAAADLTVRYAVRQYMTFAQEQLAYAAGHEPAGSVALYGLARVYAALAEQDPARYVAVDPKMVSLYYAAVLVHPENHLAANELGVLLARHGFYATAEAYFERSLAIAPSVIGWRNLATLRDRMGQHETAAAARNQAAAAAADARGGQTIGAQSNVRWVDPERFAQLRNVADINLPRQSAPAADAKNRQARANKTAEILARPWRMLNLRRVSDSQ